MQHIYPFVPNAPFLYCLKTSENLTVSDVFRGSKKGASGKIGLKVDLFGGYFGYLKIRIINGDLICHKSTKR